MECRKLGDKTEQDQENKMEDKHKMTEKVGCRRMSGTRVDYEKDMWINDQEWSRSRRQVEELDAEKKMDG